MQLMMIARIRIPRTGKIGPLRAGRSPAVLLIIRQIQSISSAWPVQLLDSERNVGRAAYCSIVSNHFHGRAAFVKFSNNLLRGTGARSSNICRYIKQHHDEARAVEGGTRLVQPLPLDEPFRQLQRPDTCALSASRIE